MIEDRSTAPLESGPPSKRTPYVNQSVTSVALEAYFAGQLGALVKMAAVQDRFALEHPTLLAPNVMVLGEPLAFRPFQLRSEDGAKAVAVGLSQVAFISFEYPGFEAFATEACDKMQAALGDLGVTELERVIYRYNNELGLPRFADGTTPLEDILNLDLSALQAGHLTSFHDYSLRMARSWERGVLHLGVRLDRSDTAGEVLKFSIASELRPAGPVAELSAFAVDVHEQGVDAILITRRGERRHEAPAERAA